jgi:hypothetical protein
MAHILPTTGPDPRTYRTVNVRPDDHTKLLKLAKRYRLPLIELTPVLLKAWSLLNVEQRLSCLEAQEPKAAPKSASQT